MHSPFPIQCSKHSPLRHNRRQVSKARPPLSGHRHRPRQARSAQARWSAQGRCQFLKTRHHHRRAIPQALLRRHRSLLQQQQPLPQQPAAPEAYRQTVSRKHRRRLHKVAPKTARPRQLPPGKQQTQRPQAGRLPQGHQHQNQAMPSPLERIFPYGFCPLGRRAATHCPHSPAAAVR